MTMEHYDIFISYKRKSLPTANNLYYRLTTRGYSTFFDLEEMGKDNFNVQLLNHIENAKDVFVILEDGSLDGCKQENWEEKDWFCHEIAFALEKKKNIIPILLNGYQMPSQDFFPDRLKELSLKNAPEFNFSFFEAYLDKLIEKKYLLSKPNLQEKATSVFKFYSNENCQVFKEGKLVCSLEGMSDAPFYLPVPRKGDYRFKGVNDATGQSKILNETIDVVEEKNIQIEWNKRHRKVCSFIVSIALLLFVIVVPSVLWQTANTNPPDISSPSSTTVVDTICKPVDLGLPSGTLWGDRNVDANNIYESGAYYIWAGLKPIESQPKDMVKRVDDIIGTSYDVASLILGDLWTLPSEKQVAELIAVCSWEWTHIDGIMGYLVTGPNKNSIFIPLSGCVIKDSVKFIGQFGYYWIGESHPTNNAMARELLIGKKEINIEYGYKNVGRTIRAVYNN